MDRNAMEDLKTTSEHVCLHCELSNLGLKGKIGHSGYIEQDLGQHVGFLCVLFQCDRSSHDLIQICHHIFHT